MDRAFTLVRGFAFDLGEWFSANTAQVRHNLDRYFNGVSGDLFTGRWFEKFASMSDPDRFDAADMLAVESLSVKVPPESAAMLIITEAERFSSLLHDVPRDVDLWDVDHPVIDMGGPAAELHTMLGSLHGVGWVTAGKLMAAKRPRLIPILDNKVKSLLAPPRRRFWMTMHEQLSDEARRRTITEVCATAPDDASLLRRIDVALWMHATQQPKATGGR